MYKTAPIYIIAAHRTPIGKLYGALSSVRPDDLVAGLLAAMLKKHNFLIANELEAIYLGSGNQAGEDNRNIARMAVLLNGLPNSIFASTQNSLCTSGMDALMQAARMIGCGEAEFCIAGGVDSMSRSPWVESRNSGERVDSTLGWRFTNPRISELMATHSMPETAELLSKHYGIGREAQDFYAFESRNRYEAALQAGLFEAEVLPVDWPEGQLLLSKDEQHRLLSLEMMAQLPGLVKGAQNITLGNSARIGDGAALLALASENYIKKHKIKPLARLHTMAVAGEHPDMMGIAGATALKKALSKSGLSVSDIGLFEMSEAFAVQVLACMQALDLPAAAVNPNGGAISMGNPLGMGAARLLVSLLHQLTQNPKVQFGAAAVGAGLGVGTAVILENLSKHDENQLYT